MAYWYYRIPLRPITKKNSQRIVLIHGRPAVIPSSQYKRYEKEALLFLRAVAMPIESPVNIAYTYWFHPNKDGSIPKQPPDLTNLMEATDDILIKAGIIKDDNCMIVRMHDGSKVFYDPVHEECTEIEIREMTYADSD